MLTTEFDDFDETAAYFANWEGNFEQLSRGRFVGTIRAAEGHQVRAVSLNANQVLLVRGLGDSGYFSLTPVTRKNESALWQGRELSAGHLVIQGPDADTDHRTGRCYRTLTVSIPANFLHSAAVELLSSAQIHYSRGWEVRAISPEAHRQLIEAGTRLIECPSPPGTSEFRQCEEECLRAAVLTLSLGTENRRCELSLPARTRLVRRAEELFRANLKDPLGSVTVCSTLEVSDRTLRLAFKERFGIGPMAFYRQIRLNAARKVLTSGESDSVQEVAHRFGFHHLSNFAADYRKAFGELPSYSGSRRK